MKRFISGLLIAVFASSVATAQTSGLIPSGRVLGNSSASRGLPSPVTMTSMLDRAMCSTNNSAVVRVAGVWNCVSTLPSSLMTYLAPGTGAVSRTMAQRFDQQIFADDYSVKCDYVSNVAPGTDDSVNLQKAFDYASSTLKGGVVRLPPGKLCRLDSTVKVTGNNVILDCQNSTIVNNVTVLGIANAPAIQFGDGINTKANNGLVNCLGGQNSSLTPVAGNRCFYFIHQILPHAENLTIGTVGVATNACYTGLELDDTNTFHGNNIRSHSNLFAGLVVIESGDPVFSQLHTDSNGSFGAAWYDSSGAKLSNATAFFNGTAYLLDTVGRGAGTNQWFQWNDVVGDTSKGDNWIVRHVRDFKGVNLWGSTQSGWIVTSGSAATVGTGVQVFGVSTCSGVNGGNTAFAGDTVSNLMTGTVTSCVGTTLTLNITSVLGSGSHSNWTIVQYTGNGFLLDGAGVDGFSVVNLTAITNANNGIYARNTGGTPKNIKLMNVGLGISGGGGNGYLGGWGFRADVTAEFYKLTSCSMIGNGAAAMNFTLPADAASYPNVTLTACP